MLRFLFSLLFYVVVARWIYAEARIVTPTVVPMIDSGLSVIAIPTHDTWDERAKILLDNMPDDDETLPKYREQRSFSRQNRQFSWDY